MSLNDVGFVILITFIVVAGGVAAFMFGYILPEEITVENKNMGNDLGKKGVDIPSGISNHETDLGFGKPANIEDYSWLTSISMYRYKDLPESLEYFCAGTILTPDIMMTGDSCNSEYFTKEDLRDAVVRSNSAYFSKDGITHNVQEVIDNPELKEPYKYIYLLKVYPEFNEKTVKPKIIHAPSVKRRSIDDGKFVVAGWGGAQDQKEQIGKNTPFGTYEWLPEKLVTCTGNLCHEASTASSVCCNKAVITCEPAQTPGPVSGKVLVNVRSGDPQILAIELLHLFKGTGTTEHDLAYFVDIGNAEFVEWLKSQAPEVVVDPNEEIDEGTTATPVYLQMQTATYFKEVQYFQEFNPLEKYMDLPAELFQELQVFIFRC